VEQKFLRTQQIRDAVYADNLKLCDEGDGLSPCLFNDEFELSRIHGSFARARGIRPIAISFCFRRLSGRGLRD
jgi:hypothetical protein